MLPSNSPPGPLAAHAVLPACRSLPWISVTIPRAGAALRAIAAPLPRVPLALGAPLRRPLVRVELAALDAVRAGRRGARAAQPDRAARAAAEADDGLRRRAQRRALGRRELPHLAGQQLAELHRADGDAREVPHLVPESRADAADLAPLAL